MNDSPLGKAIVGVSISAVPLVGPIIGLVLCVMACRGGSAAVIRARARPDRAGLGKAIATKWIGFGGIFQNAMMLVPMMILFLEVLAFCGVTVLAALTGST